MQVEHDIRIIPIDKDHQAELKKMAEEGWVPAPGFPPFAVYPVVRSEATQEMQKSAGFGGQMGGYIDETKVHIIKGGKADTQ